MVKDIKIADFDYNLPEEKIPVHPLKKRDECKLLLCSPQGNIYHRIFKELPGFLPVDSLMVCNDTKVINARLPFHKDTGAAIELFLLEPFMPSDYALNFQAEEKCMWKCLVGNSKKWKNGEISLRINVNSHEHLDLKARRESINDDGSAQIEFSWDNPEFKFGKIIELAGKIPIPPYLNRDTEDSDTRDYQTVYAREKGSVAAPTAGLHFTPNVLEAIEAHNIKIEKVTLHVGAGTFRPVKSEIIGEHPMHAEPFSMSRDLLIKILEWKKEKKPVIAIGTTSVRTLESLPYIGKNLMQGKPDPFFVNQWDPYTDYEDFDTVLTLKKIIDWMEKNDNNIFHASTAIMIAPGFKWRITDGIMTNFHQPKSTLLLLVSSFLGGDKWKDVYEEALSHNYRFLSYGDASLLLK